METKIWQVLSSIFSRIVTGRFEDQPPDVREKCRADPRRRLELEEYLEAHQNPHPLVERLSPTSDGLTEAEPRASTTSALPKLIGGYRIEERLGEGGMGVVYRAHHPRLQRDVAIKTLPRSLAYHADLRTRILNDAQSLAKVAHDRVCRVYDIGEEDGRPFIVMELVEGEPLELAATRMSVEQRLLIMSQVAEALHAAHRIGLIHRDVKPSNILVETDEDGSRRPVLMDFGLARPMAHSELTLSGSVLGTPPYMAPEQARGEASLDRRVDVYGLGATLYAIMAGEPPFSGATPSETLARVETVVPRSIREIQPSIAREIDAIAQHALRKRRDDRYPSARAFAEDVTRYLNGEPIRARAYSRLERLQLRMARNRPLVRIMAIAGAALLVAMGWGVTERVGALRRAQLAQEFGGEVERISTIARLSAMSPAHDVRSDRALIRRRMSAIQDVMTSQGSHAAGAGNYALGRGYLALQDYQAAETHLSAGWELGYRTPEAALALGITLSELHQDALLATEWQPDPTARARLRAQADSTYRQPARRYLSLAADGPLLESPAYVTALRLHQDGDHEAALLELEEATAVEPWLHEAYRLQGDIHRTLLGVAGDSTDAVTVDAHYASARSCYDRSRDVAESDVRVHQAIAMLVMSRVGFERASGGGDVVPFIEDGAQAIESGLALLPTDQELLLLKAELAKNEADHLITIGEDPTERLQVAIDAATAALAHDSTGTRGHRALGNAYRTLADHQRSRGQDASSSLAHAIAALETVQKVGTATAADFTSIGLLNNALAQSLRDQGKECERELDAAIAAHRRAASLAPDDFRVRYNLARAYHTRAVLEFADDEAESFLDEADRLFRELAAERPGSIAVHFYAGRALAHRAAICFDQGGDGRPLTEEAVASYRRALAVNPGSSYDGIVWNAIGAVLEEYAGYLADRELPAAAVFDSAQAAFSRAVARNASDHLALSNWSGLLIRRAGQRSVDDVTALAYYRRAIELARRSLEVNDRHVFAAAYWAGAHRGIASRLPTGSEEFRVSVRVARDSLRSVIQMNQALAYPFLELGRVHLILAEEDAASRRDPTGHLEEAVGYLERAGDLFPRVESFLVARTEALTRIAENSGSDTDLKRAEDSLARGHGIHPDLPQWKDLSTRLIRCTSRANVVGYQDEGHHPK